MRVLLDEQLPRQLARQLKGHTVRTVQQEGWAGLKNGELLRRAVAAGFEVFATADRNLRFQQNLAGFSICVLVVRCRTSKLEDLVPLVPPLLKAIREARPGDIRQITVP